MAFVSSSAVFTPCNLRNVMYIINPSSLSRFMNCVHMIKDAGYSGALNHEVEARRVTA
jgi:hypothetical protein